MCALVQHFLCPLSSNIISGVLKSFNSEQLQREQLALSSEQWRITATVIHEESSSVCGQGELQWCLRVFYSPFWRRNSTRIAMLLWQPYLFLRFICYVHSGLRHFSMMIRWQLLPQVKFRMCPSPDDSTSVRWRTSKVQPRITGVHLWSLPVFYVII